MACRSTYAGRIVPLIYCIQKLVKKLETSGSLISQYAGGRKMSAGTIHDVKKRSVESSSKSLEDFLKKFIFLIPRVKELLKNVKLAATVLCVCRSRFYSEGQRKTYTMFFTVPTFRLLRFGDFGPYMVYERNMVSYKWVHHF